MLDIEPECTVECSGPISALATLTRKPGLLVATGDRITLWANNGRSNALVTQKAPAVNALQSLPTAAGAEAVLGDGAGRVSVILSFETPSDLQVLAGEHASSVVAVGSVFNGNQWLVVSASSDGTLITNRIDAAEHSILAGPQGCQTAALCVASEANPPFILTGKEDGTVCYWSATEPRPPMHVVRVGMSITALCVFLKRGRLWAAAGTASGRVLAWDVERPDHRVSLASDTGPAIVSLTWLTDSAFPLLASLDELGALHLWSVSNEACVGLVRVGSRGVCVVEPMGRPALVAAYDSSWTAFSVDLDRYILDLESQGSGA